ncbi:MAG: hypothetical protein CM15mP103_00130 [Gammaproteobacteria bacterium]|nr:MAG: hypothetical protein CM15mP103_00130 [Gammaproteobacteria bacterium]
MPKVAPAERSEMMAFEFTARDGLVLRGYLTLPKSTQGKRPPPLIVNPTADPSGPATTGDITVRSNCLLRRDLQSCK